MNQEDIILSDGRLEELRASGFSDAAEEIIALCEMLDEERSTIISVSYTERHPR